MVRRRVKHPLRLFGLLLAVVFLLGLALELGAVVVFTWILPKPRLIQYDAQLGWKNKANFTGTRLRSDGESWEMSTDNHGRRVTFKETQTANQSIVFLGDSFTFGDSVKNQHHFLSLLNKKLKAKLFNLGVVGYTSDQEFLAFKEFDQKVNTVVLMTYLGNDLRDLSRHFEQGGLRFKPKFEIQSDSMQLKEAPFQLLGWLRNKSYVMTLGLGLFYSSFPRSWIFDPQANLAEGEQLYFKTLELLLKEANMRGISKVLVVLWSEQSRNTQTGEFTKKLQDSFDSQLLAIDLDTVFRKQNSNPREFYFSPSLDPGLHWNEKGHEIVALTLQSYLTKASE